MRYRFRSRRGHPWVFMLAAGTFGAAVVHGDVGSAVLAGLAVLWTFR